MFVVNCLQLSDRVGKALTTANGVSKVEPVPIP